MWWCVWCVVVCGGVCEREEGGGVTLVPSSHIFSFNWLHNATKAEGVCVWGRGWVKEREEVGIRSDDVPLLGPSPAGPPRGGVVSSCQP